MATRPDTALLKAVTEQAPAADLAVRHVQCPFQVLMPEIPDSLPDAMEIVAREFPEMIEPFIAFEADHAKGILFVAPLSAHTRDRHVHDVLNDYRGAAEAKLAQVLTDRGQEVPRSGWLYWEPPLLTIECVENILDEFEMGLTSEESHEAENVEQLTELLKQVVAKRNDSTSSDFQDQYDEVVRKYGEALALRGTKIAEALGTIALRQVALEESKASLSQAVSEARALGLSWSDIGKAAGITPQAAHRRWDPDARAKHSEYQRNRSRKLAGKQESADGSDPE